MSILDTSDIKERQRKNWAAAAEGWKRRDEILRKGAAPVTQRMLELSNITAGSKLLDIASGTGEPAISAAQIVGETGHVTGTDLVDDMLNVARDKAKLKNLSNIEFQCVDGETLNYPSNSFDAVTIRWGLMFMPQPKKCLLAAHNALKLGGHISLACWAAPDKNPFISVLMKTLANYMTIPTPPPGSPGIFAFADPQQLQDVIKSANFTNITLEEMVIDVLEVEDGQAYWEVVSDLAAPVMALVQQLNETDRTHYIQEVIEVADTMKQGDTLRMQGTTWIASADK
ncbi:hypothetical protein MNBD_GAMMA12-3328 [hydrothermal vent metagenome]|uniref:Methyltransferase domain-containing protein n=1 Tax=hydrothermal vent metagenome TaxID=652676 RepID=A0A3B0YAF8_9ZZZZ